MFRRRVWKGCLGDGSWAATLALCRQHFRKPIHRSQAGEAPEVLSGRRKEEFVVGSVRTSQSQTREAEYPLEVREQHLDFLSTATGLRIFRRCGVRTDHVAGVFVQIPWDLAGDRVGAATRLELADVAIHLLAR